MKTANSADLTPNLLQTLLGNIFSAMERPGYPSNEHLMKCCMRIVVVGNASIVGLVDAFLNKLQTILHRTVQNPTNPVFNHSLFETISALVKFVCEANPSAVDRFEEILFPPFQNILANGVEEFIPYSLQVLAQILDAKQGGQPSQAYLSLFPPLLSPMLWETRGNVPAAARLLESYLRKYGNQIVDSNKLQAILGIFQKCISSTATQNHAFGIIISIIEALPLEMYQSYLTTIMQVALTRLSSSKSLQFAKKYVHFLCVLAGNTAQPYAVGRSTPFKPDYFFNYRSKLSRATWIRRAHIKKEKTAQLV